MEIDATHVFVVVGMSMAATVAVRVLLVVAGMVMRRMLVAMVVMTMVVMVRVFVAMVVVAMCAGVAMVVSTVRMAMVVPMVMVSKGEHAHKVYQ